MNAVNGQRPRPASDPVGWRLLAFGDELAEPVTGLSLGSRALVAVRDQGRIRVFDGTCPHRGAHLGYGGCLTDGPGIICPFHGKWIGLGEQAGSLSVREHEVIDGGGAVFVRLTDVPARDHGFAGAIGGILPTHELSGAVTLAVRVPPELIIENAFDFAHFPTVHLTSRLARPEVKLGDDGELSIMTSFRTGAPAWEAAEGDFTSRFHARAFNPGLVVTELGPPGASNFVVTGATAAEGGCLARIAVAVRRTAADGTAAALIEGAKLAFEQDLLVWNHLDLTTPARLDSRDTPVLAFRAFCASFAAAPARAAG
ncbi:MAG TPA: Rieske 2Fe-2S domain-containing protein [Streptosporangiaceae bacterium]|jgi:phenylpropionate dioxygenase-like ring-hydroxylating dioxygenase large terminal subunit